ncbi:MAG: hypothetical protein QY331_08560 [Melioribacteraceae bacterium]|jgi:hypothetical protein|nr:hypothetical protein [Melioribacteraceae bacterium]RJP59345.1 MAG: hypothetical protein C4543_06745 [Ignavibacteriales bacterium]WKZ68004.1 MAG: hypothetical protein QY331_08560 [Melioribacteraceae bacterium]
MFFKRTQHKKFDYTPRFYDPDKDEELKDLERRKRRLGFRTSRARQKVKIKSPIYYLILFIILVLIYLKFTGII